MALPKSPMFPLYSFKQDAQQCCLLLQALHKCNWSLPVVMDEHTTSDGWIKEGLTNLQLPRLFLRIHAQTFLHFPLSLSLGFNFSSSFLTHCTPHLNLPSVLSLHSPLCCVHKQQWVERLLKSYWIHRMGSGVCTHIRTKSWGKSQSQATTSGFCSKGK